MNRTVSILALFVTTILFGQLNGQELPLPPPTSALKATHVEYGRSLYVAATTRINILTNELYGAQDIRSDVLKRLEAIEAKVEAPEAPANGAILLAWADMSHDESQFSIEQSEDGSVFVLVGNVPANTSTYTVSGLKPGLRYWFRVRATNSAGVSDYSNVADSAAGVRREGG